MCGIFGIVSQHPTPAQSFIDLAQINRERGNLAFGMWADGQLIKQPHPFVPEMVTQTHIQKALGHIRAPTARQTNDPRAIHPFETSDLLLAHNGLLLNAEAFPQWRLYSDLNVDTQIIIGGIQAQLTEHAIVPAIQHTIQQLEGQQACWLWHKPSQTLYLWRVMAPIWVSQAEQFTFSSIRTKKTNRLLDEGVIYQLTADLTLHEKETFTYQSPYFTKR